MTYEYREWLYGPDGIPWRSTIAHENFERLESDGWQMFVPTAQGLVLRRLKTLCPKCLGYGCVYQHTGPEHDEIYRVSCPHCSGACYV